MKKLLALMIVLAMAGLANAALLISVDGVVNPADTTININPSDEVIIDIWGDGDQPFGEFFLGISTESTGSGTLNIDDVVILYDGTEAVIDWFDDTEIAEILGVYNPFLGMGLGDAPPVGETPKELDGVLIDNIIFHCTGLGDVTLILTNGDGELLDSQVIHQIPVPEPMTITLLGLGGLLLRRRK